MDSVFFFSLVILCLGSLLIGITATWYKVAKLNRIQGIIAMFFPPFVFLFGALNFSKAKWSYILLLAGFCSSLILFLAIDL